MKSFIIAAAFLIIPVFGLSADQAAWISYEQSAIASNLVRSAGEIRHYCAPCGDKTSRHEKVLTVFTVKANPSDPDSEYFETEVNGEGIDLAYVYILLGGQWRNLAVLLNIEVTGVPENLTGKEFPEAKK